MQIVPGVFLVNGFPYRRHQNGYLVQRAGATILIDSGDMEEDSFHVVERNCARWGVSVPDISHLFITHAHYDHSSHAARLKATGTNIVATRSTAEAIAAGDDRCIPYAMNRPFPPCDADIVVSDGEITRVGGLEVRCIAAPGHADGLAIFEIDMEGEVLWFCGDLMEVGPECQTLELGWPGGVDFNRPIYIETLSRLWRMRCDVLLPGHGPPLIGNGIRLVQMAYKKAMVEWR